MIATKWFELHSFILVISIAPLQVHYYSEALPTTARKLYQSFKPNRTATVGKGLAEGPYMAARARVEPTTLRLKAIDSTKAPPCPTTQKQTDIDCRGIHITYPNSNFVYLLYVCE